MSRAQFLPKWLINRMDPRLRGRRLASMIQNLRVGCTHPRRMLSYSLAVPEVRPLPIG